jgi:hypothetical protein
MQKIKHLRYMNVVNERQIFGNRIFVKDFRILFGSQQKTIFR